MLTITDWIYGISVLATVFLSIVAGLLAITLFGDAKKKLRAWKYLVIALVLFTFEEIFGALKVFGVYSTPHITHIIPSFILAFLIAALVQQIIVAKGWVK